MRSECSEHQKKIAALLLGDLTQNEGRVLEAHLAECSNCRSERDSFARTIELFSAAGEESIPHHFFIHPQEKSDPWTVFRLMRPRWQALAASAAILFFLFGIAAVSRLQIESNAAGWSVGFGRSNIDVAALKKEVLQAAEKENQESRAAWMDGVRTELEQSYGALTQQQKVQLTAALARMESRVAGRISASEERVADGTQKLVTDVYRNVAQQRARDLEAINLRFDSADASDAIKTRQTNEILGTLLQVAELKLK